MIMNALTQPLPEEEKADVQHKIASWINNLVLLTKKADRSIDERWIATLTNALMAEFKSWYFCKSSMLFIAKRHEFFPSFKEICDDFKEWIEAERARRNLTGHDQGEYETQRFKRLSESGQALVKSFRINQSKQWRHYAVGNNTEGTEINPPPFDEQIRRENQRANWLHDKYPEAWAYLFPKEAEEERKAKDFSKDYTEDQIYRTVMQIQNGPQDRLTALRLNALRAGIRRYAPQNLAFFEELVAEKPEVAS